MAARVGVDVVQKVVPRESLAGVIGVTDGLGAALGVPQGTPQAQITARITARAMMELPIFAEFKDRAEAYLSGLESASANVNKIMEIPAIATSSGDTPLEKVRSYIAAVNDRNDKCRASLAESEAALATARDDASKAIKAAEEAAKAAGATGDIIQQSANDEDTVEESGLKQSAESASADSESASLRSKTASERVVEGTSAAQMKLAVAKVAMEFGGDAWASTMKAALELTDDFYNSEDLVTFTPILAKTAAPSTVKKERLPELQLLLKFVIGRTTAYAASLGVDATTDDGGAIQYGRQSAKALRALHAALSAYQIPTPQPAWFGANGALKKVIIQLVAAEYRIQFQVSNKAKNIKELSSEMKAALMWADSTISIGSDAFKKSAKAAYALAWDA